MVVKRLYIIGKEDDDIEVLLMACLLNPMDYKVVKGRCGGDESESVGAMYYEYCIEEVEVEVDGRPFGRVLGDIYNIYLTGRVNMDKLTFIAETERGEYLQFGINEVIDVMESEDEEEW
jgi:hypothetical protein